MFCLLVLGSFFWLGSWLLALGLTLGSCLLALGSALELAEDLILQGEDNLMVLAPPVVCPESR